MSTSPPPKALRHPATNPEDSELIAALHRLTKKSPKLVKSSTYAAPTEPEITVRSWKMNEFKYYDIPSPFPTLARGIFTYEVGDEEAQDDSTKYRIVARGYDKFFNIGEVPWTTWASLTDHTAAPYTLSLKSNGCIIFIGALTPTKLLITSKHSVGAIEGVELSHAQAGEEWLRKYFAQKGKTEEELAQRLWKNNWTAVAELCDDSFEEHVLAYPPERTGLHLHGLNMCSKDFATLPHPVVDEFAEEWGFIRTKTVTLNSIAEVQEFTAQVAEAQHWEGEAVEGFVVRTHVTEPPDGRGTSQNNSASPYAPGSSFFFKVKFDEPYMMYRDWREVTKSLLSQKGGLSETTLPRNKMKCRETQLYVRWVIGEIRRDRKQFDGYTKGKGIIATRERFLKWLETREGKADLAAVEDGDDASIGLPRNKEFGKTIIVPVAIPGCGKTTVAVALSHIFGFGHTQSDDVQAKKPAPVFLKNVTQELKTHDVVIADKNNHLKQHRTQLRDIAITMSPPARLLALNWALDKPQSTIHRVCGDRVLLRGDNHQTLRADVTLGKSHESVLWQFINSTEELTGSEVDDIIDMDLEEDLGKAVQRAVDGICDILKLDKPSSDKIQEGIDVALGYKVKTRTKRDETTPKEKTRSPRYYALLPEIQVEKVLEKTLGSSDDTHALWTHLKENDRITKRSHVTLVHEKSLPGQIELWERSAALHQMNVPPMFELKLGSVVWNERIMAISVDDVKFVEEESNPDAAQGGAEFVSKLSDDARRGLHITVGTRDSSVPPVEAKDLVERWRKGDTIDVYSVPVEETVVKGRIKGLVA
ncbi:rna ligase [Moniliophthora roreri MCA 2997]|uniref:tRNA ligase n=2 Tax=Moniliophthora roreri TaxID=221103 RepID=V2XNV4_MONRO|nr:rna ligase [Moniliophthora roreri MCA 2997]KAI3619158.1 rna ligase [Moniliophthora roreri]